MSFKEETGLLTSMAQKLARLEKQNIQQSQQLAEKVVWLNILRIIDYS